MTDVTAGHYFSPPPVGPKVSGYDGAVIGDSRAGFDIATPQLAAPCTPSTRELGPDLQGLTSGDPFHPTAVGELRMASSLVWLIKP